MKYLVLLTFILGLSISCKKAKEKTEQANFIILSGEVKNPKAKIITISKANDKPIEIPIDSTNKFRDTLMLPEGYYNFGHDRGISLVYLNPSFDLAINVDAEMFNNSLQFSGIGAKENQFLRKKEQKLYDFKLKSKMFNNELNETEFLKLSDSLVYVYESYLTEQKGLDADFIAAEKNAILLEEHQNLERFRQNSFYSRKELSANYPKPFKKIDFQNEDFLKHPNFFYATFDYFNGKSWEAKKENDSISTILYRLTLIDQELKNEKVKNAVLYRDSNLSLGGRGSKHQEKLAYCEEYLKISTDKKYNAEIQLIYNNLQKTCKGKPSPNFEFEDLDAKLVSLKDLKGKPVFIDIWATWCSPCIQQFPGVKILEEKYKNIQFVGICMDSKKINGKVYWINTNLLEYSCLQKKVMLIFLNNSILKMYQDI